MTGCNMPSKEDNHHIFTHYKDDDYGGDRKETYQKCPRADCFIDQVRNYDGSLKIKNPHLLSARSDYLYHLGFGIENNRLHEKFGDVKVSVQIDYKHCVVTLILLVCLYGRNTTKDEEFCHLHSGAVRYKSTS